ncbi:cytochrome P450 2J2-like isoform X2 [Podarcis lilfordi]|uniref:Cytochrome P450 2J2-like isoform X2 n=1 Tax=Podarcis lilfordi TaxID=74358 RepID=A0AA35KGV0_9SAUR|nr:cytochrome P450 2J2-like isoform X2 [Podarcis lilfordi]
MLHIYTKKPPLKLRKLTEKYGNVFSLQIGSMWIVVVNGFHLVKEALVHQGKNFTDRPKAPVANEIFRKVSLPWTAVGEDRVFPFLCCPDSEVCSPGSKGCDIKPSL